MTGNDEVVERLYRAFNSRDIDCALSTMHPDVIWANGLDGGHVYGKEKVREYWLKQWNEMETYAEPIRIRSESEDRVCVDVRLTAFGRGGEKRFDTIAEHAFQFEDGLVRRFDIVPQ